eukprot:6545323-Prorocentrum_lima.AAC.1
MLVEPRGLAVSRLGGRRRYGRERCIDQDANISTYHIPLHVRGVSMKGSGRGGRPINSCHGDCPRQGFSNETLRACDGLDGLDFSLRRV